jgi:zinc protease
MKTMKRFLKNTLTAGIAICLLAPVSASLSASDSENIAAKVNIDYEMFTLDNGLTTIVYTDHSTPTIYIGMYYGVGSKDEPPGKTGFAHLFEHLMFQGTENREGEYFEPFTLAGATGMNGTTNSDRTNYYATVPTGALDMALWMESDRISYLLGAIDQEALDEQRDVVKNEKRQGENRPYSALYDRVLEGLYPVGHPYRHSTIGSMDDLDNASLEDVHDWFNKYYGASNTVLVLSGDIDLETAREKVSFYFGEAPAGDPLLKRTEWVPELTEIKRETIYDRVGQTKLVRAWTLPNMNHRDTTLMYLVNETLLGNKNSPLYSKLVDQLQLATGIGGQAMGSILSGIYLLTADLRPGVEPEQVLNIIDQTIAEYLQSGPDVEILENAKLGVNMWLVGSMESKARIGSMLAEGQLFSNDPLYVKKELQILNDATADDLKSVAERWLTRNYYELTFLPFAELSSSEPLADRSEIPAVGEVGGVTFPEIRTTTLDNGMDLVVAQRGSIPLVNVFINVATGQTANTQPGSVTSEAAWYLLDKGTEKYNANELAAAKDKIAMGSRNSPGAENSGMSYRILSTYLDESLKIASEILRHPTFPQDELDKFKANVNASLDNQERNPGRMARTYFTRAIYGEDEPTANIWTRDTVAGLSSDDLKAFMEREVAPDNTRVYMVGDISLEDAAKALNDAFGDWDNKNESRARPIGTVEPTGPRVILVDQPGAVQANIVAGHAIEAYDADSQTELSIMNGVFGGSFEARINMNLREDKGWSYGIYSGISGNITGNRTIAVSGSVQIDKTVESMAEIKKEYEEFISTRPAQASELEREVLNGTRSIPGRFEGSGGFLNSIVVSDRRGLPFEYAEGAAARLQALNLEGIQARAETTLQPDKLTWVVVGDLSEIEEKIRALNYGEVEIWDTYGNKLR